MSCYFTWGAGTGNSCNLIWRNITLSANIPTTGSTGLVADAGTQTNATSGTTYTRTITCKSAGTWDVCMIALDAQYGTQFFTTTRTVTVATLPLLKVNIGGVWKACPTMWVNIGGTWKLVISIKVNVGGTWDSGA
jgi:hypothetical protein